MKGERIILRRCLMYLWWNLLRMLILSSLFMLSFLRNVWIKKKCMICPFRGGVMDRFFRVMMEWPLGHLLKKNKVQEKKRGIVGKSSLRSCHLRLKHGIDRKGSIVEKIGSRTRTITVEIVKKWRIDTSREMSILWEGSSNRWASVLVLRLQIQTLKNSWETF